MMARNIEIEHFFDSYSGDMIDLDGGYSLDRHRIIARQNLMFSIQRRIDQRGQGASIGKIHERIEPGRVTWMQKAAWLK